MCEEKSQRRLVSSLLSSSERGSKGFLLMILSECFLCCSTAKRAPVLSLSDFDSLSEEDMAENNQLAFDVAECEFGIQPVIRGEEMAAQAEPDQLLTVLYLSRFYEAFRVSPGNSSGQVPSCSFALFIWLYFRSSFQPTADLEQETLKEKSCSNRSCWLFFSLQENKESFSLGTAFQIICKSLYLYCWLPLLLELSL